MPCIQLDARLFSGSLVVFGRIKKGIFLEQKYRNVNRMGDHNYISVAKTGSTFTCYSFHDNRALEFPCDLSKQYTGERIIRKKVSDYKGNE